MTSPNAVTCDVEDYFQVESLRSVVSRESWQTMPSRLERNTERVLDLFDQAGVRGTFFVLGWCAERRPGLVRRIAEAGHEIASHGFAHTSIISWMKRPSRADSRAVGERPNSSVPPPSMWPMIAPVRTPSMCQMISGRCSATSTMPTTGNSPSR